MADQPLIHPYAVVKDFEQRMADWAGSKYAVAVESGTAALFLSCLYKKVGEVTIPSHTYPSVPCSILNAGGTVRFVDKKWEGVYELEPYGIIDGALRMQKGMYHGGLHCLSFHLKKHLPLGRGGMILTDDEEAYKWLKKARFDGRDEKPLDQDDLTQIGWNMYMTPEQAIRGIQIFELIKNDQLEDLPTIDQNYPDLSEFPTYGSHPEITIRPAGFQDTDDLLEWKNDPDTRKFSIVTQDVILKENHKKWLADCLFDKNRELNILFYNGEKCGDLRFDIGPETIEVSIRLAKEFRGKGIGSAAIKKYCPTVKRMYGKPIIAKIVNGNLASMNVFIANGFKPIKYEEGYYTFIK